MNILILGGEGMAGSMIGSYLSKHYSVCCTTRKELDIEKEIKLPLGFDFIINCIGVLVKDSEINLARTIYINSYFPKYLEYYYKYSKTKIIHLSTDCVFDGYTGNYFEESIPNEINIYGRSKALGEIINNKDLTLRTSIIGPEIKDIYKRSGLFNWILSTKEKQLNGWTNALWSGITTLELAKCIEQYIHNPIISGIHHPVNESIDKYSLLCKINEIYGLGKIIVPIQGPKTVNKVLVDTKKFFKVSNYDTQLRELKNYT